MARPAGIEPATLGLEGIESVISGRAYFGEPRPGECTELSLTRGVLAGACELAERLPAFYPLFIWAELGASIFGITSHTLALPLLDQ